MPWPSWAFWRQSNDERKQTTDDKHNASSTTPTLPFANTSESNEQPWTTSFTTPQTILISFLTTATTLAALRFYKTYLRRIPTIDHLKPNAFRHRSLYGYVTRVGDGDNFHLFHTPGGRLLGWGWAPRRRPKDIIARAAKSKGGQSVHVRLAGVDAPEMAHFGRPEQPFAKEALEWLKGFLGGRYVRVYPYRADQYHRVVCGVYRRRWGVWNQDVGLQMLKRGLATVYEAKFGSEFGNKEEEYRAAEARAKERKVGMWQDEGLLKRLLGKKQEPLESPRAYKQRMALEEKEKAK